MKYNIILCYIIYYILLLLDFFINIYNYFKYTMYDSV